VLEQTFWNGELTPCKKVSIVVGKAPVPTWWFHGLEGTVRKAVEIQYKKEAPFYIDDEDGVGWLKVTLGRGGPDWGHSSLAVTSVSDRV
jgi:hypothetical protein